ncbi:MAG: CocE/NonD family hydrolase [Gemmatimonadales bacterium]
MTSQNNANNESGRPDEPPSKHNPLRTRVATWLVRALTRRFGLPAPTVSEVAAERDAAVEMADGTVLLTDSWYPRGAPDSPVILIRTPYGRADLTGMLIGAILAHQGFRVVTQSCRGTAGSGGEFDPFRHEVADAKATVAWLRRQPWFRGKFATYGASYVGYTQWALAVDPPPELAAMVLLVAPIDPAAFLYSGGVLAYDVLLTWMQLMPDPPSRLRLLFGGQKRQAQAVRDAASRLPLRDGYLAANRGRRSAFFDGCLDHPDAADPWWRALDQSAALDRVTAPVLLIGGWHDFYARDMVGQFARLDQRGVATALLMGATPHAGYFRSTPVTLPQTLAWLRAAFAGERPALAGQVLAEPVGGGDWQRFDHWPPPSVAPSRLYLQEGGGLAATSPDAATTHRYRYDPADPTPSVDGGLLATIALEDTTALLERQDVRSYATTPLEHDTEIGGPIQLEIWFSSSLARADLFAKLCRVTKEGRWLRVSDAIRRFRIEPSSPDRAVPHRLEMALAPALCRFLAGERIGLLVSSGAHPRFLRNNGSAQPLATATELLPADQGIHLGPCHPSAILLPVLRGR